MNTDNPIIYVTLHMFCSAGKHQSRFFVAADLNKPVCLPICVASFFAFFTLLFTLSKAWLVMHFSTKTRNTAEGYLVNTILR